MARLLATCAAAIFAVPAFAQIGVDFEEPDYTIGTLDGQSGGGIAWQMFEPVADAYVATPGFNSAQSGLWEVDALGTDSDGDDMLGFFDNGQAAAFSVSGMSFAQLQPNRPDGTSRAGHFFVSDVDFAGSAITWLGNGNIGYWGGGGFFINDTGAPIIYDQWVPFELQLDYPNNQVTVFYNNAQVAQDTLTAIGNGYATQLDIWLDTIALADNPNPGDYMRFDDIVITPEPASLGLLAAGLIALRRR